MQAAHRRVPRYSGAIDPRPDDDRVEALTMEGAGDRPAHHAPPPRGRAREVQLHVTGELLGLRNVETVLLMRRPTRDRALDVGDGA